ncbi:MAG: aminotransferase class V-fold PLP-dependent enzyme [Actinobacteria bacterium]|nr:aminotransferase class V-fold PLP-dependent enzyme [Actinomycetota bacterium]
MTADHAARAQQLDQEDPLASFREQFVIADPHECYLDGNSLGRLPKSTVTAVNALLSEWGNETVQGWQHWVDEAQRTGDLIGASVLGAAPGQVLACDTTSVNFYQLCAAAIAARPGRRTIITDAANFPTDRYIMQGLADAHDLRLVIIDNESDASTDERITVEQLRPLLGDDVALVSLQVVQYRSGARNDIAALTDAVRECGALLVWDASHAVGAVPLDFDRNSVDLAVGCTYKYLNSGPGAPAWLYVNHTMQRELQVPIHGWFAQSDQFAMGAQFERAEGIRGFQIASPSLIGLRCINSSVELIAQAGIHAIAEKAARATELIINVVDDWLAPLGFSVLTPRDADHRGGHIRLGHRDAALICPALRTQHGVVTDYRVPDSIRVAASPLTTTYSEVVEGLRRIRECVASGCYRDAAPNSGRVT